VCANNTVKVLSVICYLKAQDVVEHRVDDVDISEHPLFTGHRVDDWIEGAGRVAEPQEHLNTSRVAEPQEHLNT